MEGYLGVSQKKGSSFLEDAKRENKETHLDESNLSFEIHITTTRLPFDPSTLEGFIMIGGFRHAGIVSARLSAIAT